VGSGISVGQSIGKSVRVPICESFLFGIHILFGKSLGLFIHFSFGIAIGQSISIPLQITLNLTFGIAFGLSFGFAFHVSLNVSECESEWFTLGESITFPVGFCKSIGFPVLIPLSQYVSVNIAIRKSIG
jgi:hypothetical protein